MQDGADVRGRVAVWIDFVKDCTDHVKGAPTEAAMRQIRRMAAALGLPTLRLVQIRIGPLRLEDLLPDTWR